MFADVIHRALKEFETTILSIYHKTVYHKWHFLAVHPINTLGKIVICVASGNSGSIYDEIKMLAYENCRVRRFYGVEEIHVSKRIAHYNILYIMFLRWQTNNLSVIVTLFNKTFI